MGFGPDSRVGYVRYSALLRHVESGREFTIDVGASTGMPAASTPEELSQREVENDYLFQQVLGELSSLGSLEILSAGKFGNFKADLSL